ncbi:MAG: hypothetical protein EFT35_08000 [Methanophagales archaeon ANME-1-THS]|nr:MAG: hypothetical protein EFT35_08000 [Methanophagales archaeon ANME-1-THS]
MKFDELFRLIHFCKTIETEGTDPFDLDVKRFLETLNRYQNKWKSFDDLLVDAEAIAELAKIIELQGKWIKDRASSFYIDPVLLELKLKMLEPQQLATAFVKSWHPIISLDRLTPQRLNEGLAYWNALAPLNARNEEFPLPAAVDAAFDLDDLIALSILSRSEFHESIQAVLNELEKRGRIEYHEFIYEDTFDTSIIKAYLTSYLVSEGKALLEINPLEEKVFIAPRTVEDAHARTSSRSIPISLSYEDWLRWREKRKQGQGQNGD